MTVKRSHLDLRYVRYPVSATVGGVARDLTHDTVAFSFPARDVAPTVWLNADWETDTQGHVYARCLVGPGGTFVPAANTLYDVWIKVTDSPEIPVEKIDLFVSQ